MMAIAWMSAGSTRITVEVRSEIAFLFREGIREDWTFIEREDGSALLSFPSTDTPAALRWVAPHGERARIVHPPEVRDEARDHFRAILARYDGPPTAVPGRRSGKARR